MALVTKPQELEKGLAGTFTLNKTDLLAHPLVQASDYYSDQANWNRVSVSYKSGEGNQASTILFNIESEGTTEEGTFIVSEKARDEFLVQSVTIYDFDGGHLIIPRGSLVTNEFDVEFDPIQTIVEPPSFTAIQLSTAESMWIAGAYGANKYVIVSADSDASAYSEDGVSWTYNQMPEPITAYDMIYADNKFVIVDSEGGATFYSTDGISWNKKNLTLTYGGGGSGFLSIAYGAGKFVAVDSSNGQAIISDDGIDWASIQIPPSEYGGFSSVVFDGNRFVASPMGKNGLQSVDGEIWTPLEFPVQVEWSLGTDGEGRVIAATLGEGVYYLDSGNTFQQTNLTTDLGVRLHRIVYGNGKFLAPAIGNTIGEDEYDVDSCYYSIDGGETWQVETLATKLGYYVCFFGNGKFILTGTDLETPIDVGYITE